MKKSNYIYIVAIAAAMGSLAACQEGTDSLFNGEEPILSLSPTVTDMNQESVTRTATNSFFNKNDEITVKVTTNRTNDAGTDYTYTYNQEGIFTGGFRFNLDNTYIKTLVAKWPSDAERTASKVILDQRKLEDYRKSDRLKATSENINIMPTGTPVPLAFKHEQSRFTFRMAGQNANGLNILSVILELQYPKIDEDGKTTNGTNGEVVTESGAFWAYCDNTETAELILVPGTEIDATDQSYTIVGGRYMIGQARVGNATTQYTGGIWLDEKTSVTLQAGTDYLVTLTPEGYNLIASIRIHGFGQDEGYIGIPLQMPTLKAGNTYEVTTALQLITLSRLLAGDVKGEEATKWKGYSYTVSSALQITKNQKEHYKPIDADLKGQFKDENDNAITTIKDTDSADFYLFTE